MQYPSDTFPSKLVYANLFRTKIADKLVSANLYKFITVLFFVKIIYTTSCPKVHITSTVSKLYKPKIDYIERKPFFGRHKYVFQLSHIIKTFPRHGEGFYLIKTKNSTPEIHLPHTANFLEPKVFYANYVGADVSDY